MISRISYYTPERDCGGRDFLATMYYVSALPIIALFALGQARAYITLGMIIWVVTVSSTILVEHYSFIRNGMFSRFLVRFLAVC